jgi:LemA protein
MLAILGLGAIILLVLIFAGLFVYYYNRIRVLENRIEEAWAQIDVQLKKRYDLVPNLVNTVKGYASHEREIMEEVTKARSGMISGSRQSRIEADQELQRALGRLFAVAENYPDLKASENFRLLQEQLEGIENKIAYARQFYNSRVLQYNNLITTIPGTWFAGGREKHEFLEIEEEAREVPQVEF